MQIYKFLADIKDSIELLESVVLTRPLSGIS